MITKRQSDKQAARSEVVIVAHGHEQHPRRPCVAVLGPVIALDLPTLETGSQQGCFTVEIGRALRGTAVPDRFGQFTINKDLCTRNHFMP